MKMLFAIAIGLSFAVCAHGRLGDTEDQAIARYGVPKPLRKSPLNTSILEAARELKFEYQGWKIHCALLRATDGKEYVVREIYSKSMDAKVRRDGGSPSIKDYERDAVLEGESNGMRWTTKVIGDIGKDIPSTVANLLAHQSGLSGKVWFRDDGAIARMNSFSAIEITLDLPQALKYEAELKEIKERKQRAAVPSF